MSDYNTLKAIGDKYEWESQRRIIELNAVKIINVQNDDNYQYTHYDFKTSDGLTYEVKADLMSSKTNHFFIEYMGNAKPSGILITQADKHILISDNKYYLIDTSQLKNLISSRKYRTVSTRDKSTHGYLFPVDDVIELATRI